jgi:RNA polymerase sigma-70 factor (ECF subfamily)
MKTGREMRADDKARLFEDMMTCQEAVFRICLGFSHDPSDAEDLTQDVYLKAYRNVGRIRHPHLAREWLFRIARNTCLDHLKRRRPPWLIEKAAGPDSGIDRRSPESSSLTNERLGLLKRAVSRLPKKQRDVFVLREYGHLSYEDLGRVVGAKAGTVMSRLNRARTAVAAYLQEAEHD